MSITEVQEEQIRYYKPCLSLSCTCTHVMYVKHKSIKNTEQNLEDSDLLRFFLLILSPKENLGISNFSKYFRKLQTGNVKDNYIICSYFPKRKNMAS